MNNGTQFIKPESDIIQVGNYCYSKQLLLGSGALSNVYKGCNIITCELVAIKKIEKSNILSPFILTSIVNEINLLQKIDHPNIIKFKDFLQTQNNVYIIFEYCNNFNLLTYLEQKGILSESETISILLQVLSGVKELLRLNIVHRDIKPENILCHKVGQNIIYKIGDLGFSKKMQEKNLLLQSAIGSPKYMGLQRLSNELYSAKADVFSFGIMTYEMLFGDAPWTGVDLEDLKNNLRTKPLNFPITIIISKSMEDFLRRTLSIQEETRASWDDVFNHPIFNFQDSSLIQQTKSIIPDKQKEDIIILKKVEGESLRTASMIKR